MNGEQENLFDAHLLKTFKVGDLVSWTHLVGDKEYGFIKEIYSESKGIYRKFIFVFTFHHINSTFAIISVKHATTFNS